MDAGGLGRNRTTDTRIFNPCFPLFATVDRCSYNPYKSTTYWLSNLLNRISVLIKVGLYLANLPTDCLQIQD